MLLIHFQAQDDWQVIGSSGYSARTLAVTHGTHSIYHKKPTVVFNALMYGQKKHESCGFPAGMDPDHGGMIAL